jgi:hypothetical protein
VPSLNHRRATLLAGVAACLVFANALGNGWAVDDTPVVRDNPAAHSVSAALRAAFSPYWPDTPEEPSAGLYRPAVVASYAVDWTVSGGRPWWFHLVNVLLHGGATALVVLVVARWLSPAGALAAGVMFAVHPVHVEAVANVVGRAEILAALGILGAVLSARRFRGAPDDRVARLWFAVTILAVAFALLSKEIAVVTVVILVLDHALDAERSARPSGELYIAIGALTLGWLFLWRSVAGTYVASTAAANFRGLSAGERLATMLPVQLDVVRLLALPLELAHDYSPQTIPQRSGFGGLALLGLLTASSVLALGVSCVRRAPAAAFGILTGVAAYAPTANLFFPSGIALAERSLYLSVLVPAVAVGWALEWGLRRGHARAVLLTGGALVAVYIGRTATRTPFWKDTRATVIQGVIEHPENFRNRMWVARVSERTGDSARALAEYLVAAALFDREPLPVTRSVPLAIAMNRHRVAISEARRMHDLWPDSPDMSRWLVEAYLSDGNIDSATAVAERAIVAAPQSYAVAQIYLSVLGRRDTPEWRLLLARARVDWLSLRLESAGRRLSVLPDVLGHEPLHRDWCLDLETIWPGLVALRPAVADTVVGMVQSAGLPCQLPDGRG